MLYLPPRYAHRGTAVTPCTTYSIGFRAPSAQELAQQFLVHLQDHISLPGMYADPQLKPQTHPGEIGTAMLKQVAGLLTNIRWTDADVLAFLGGYLTEPKPHIFFYPPPQPMDYKTFSAQARKSGIQLAPKSQLLFRGNQFFINGEAFIAQASELPLLVQLADTRQAQPSAALGRDLKQRLAEWYNAGYIQLGRVVD
jgi:50S ribosomal protein L16 3-hydroxylase